MKDSEIAAKVQEMQAIAFKKLQSSLTTNPQDAGYDTLGTMLQALIKQSISRIDKFITANME